MEKHAKKNHRVNANLLFLPIDFAIPIRARIKNAMYPLIESAILTALLLYPEWIKNTVRSM